MSIHWSNIRQLNNSLNDGFEELICQLAAREEIQSKKEFWRIGKPDAGKECYWELENGDLHMWQAKYFLTSLSTTQWTEINDSVIRAIDNHKRLVKYYVCLPLDPPDSKVNGRTSMLDKWKVKANAWQDYAKAKGMSVNIVYWGNHDLINRLSRRENEGLKYFWFNKEELSDEWIDHRNRESFNALGVRYTKDLNFELPIAKVFDGLARDKNFESQIHSFYRDFLKKYKGIHLNIENDNIKLLLSTLRDTIKIFRQVYEHIHFTGNKQLPYEQFIKLLTYCSESSSKLKSVLYDLQDKEEEQSKRDYYNRPYSREISELDIFKYAINDFIYFLESPTGQLANRPFLLLTGRAGMGKSHLLADIVTKRKERQQKSLFLLGERFTKLEEPWTQILQNLLRKGQSDEFTFLGALNAKAESEQIRIVLFIDALNEGNGRQIWPKRIRSFIESFEKYTWLGLVVSIRSSFIKLIAPKEELKEELIIRTNHEGFAGFEYAAVKRFFKYYDIVLPASPLLNPEFQNPLFLKLYCKSLAERKLHHVPDGYEGLTDVIDYFINSVNLKLSDSNEWNFDEKYPLVKRVVESLLFKMVEDETDHIPYLEADELVRKVFKDVTINKEPYLQRLISEGVFNEELYWDVNEKHYDGIYFAYQRLQDHLTVSIMLDKYFDSKQPELSFQTGKLKELVEGNVGYYNQNLIESLSIQVPERSGKDLFEVAPYAKMYSSVAEGFIQSLIWRKNNSVGQSADRYVADVIIYDDYLFNQFFEATISTAMRVGFYYNAERLHTFLMKLPLPRRDHLWSIWLHDKYDNISTGTNSVRRLIDWAWNEDFEEHLHDNAVFLGCVTLSWFFTSSNRYLRDAATKGLVCLLQHRLFLIPKILEKFKGVDDPYILERIYGAAYGAVLRTNDSSYLPSVCKYIFEEVFNKGEVYPHVLLRDYARGIIEFALHQKINPQINISKVRPPYKSNKLPKKFPSDIAIEKKYMPKGESGNYGKENWGVSAILMSMVTGYGRSGSSYGDFGRYTFQRGFDDWRVDCKGLSNYAVQRIFEIGYDPKLFNQFDNIQGSGRGGDHKERIGKKYQWLVFFELLARVSDQCSLTDESDWSSKSKKTIPYDGPWYPNVRDIDPSIIIKETLEERYVDEPTNHWWFPVKYDSWDLGDKEWVTGTGDLPVLKQILEVKDAQSQSWIWLEVHPEWGEEEPLGADRYEEQHRRLWFQIRSYLVKKKDLKKIQKTFQKEFHRGELPAESRSIYTVFDREYYWSPAFNFFNKAYYDGEDWKKIYDKSERKIIASVHRTAEQINWEEEFDCSKTSPIRFYKPTQFVKEGVGLRYSSKEGEFIDSSGELTCFDPSVHNKSVSGLLIKKDVLLNWLEQKDLALVWGMVGEKQFLGGSQDYQEVDYPDRLNISGFFTLKADGNIEGKLNFKQE